jgi:hypothetical protein
LALYSGPARERWSGKLHLEGEKRMSQPKRWGGDWRSEGERMEYLNGGVGRGGGDAEHVPGWGADENERTARKGERGGGRVRGRGET